MIGDVDLSEVGGKAKAVRRPPVAKKALPAKKTVAAKAVPAKPSPAKKIVPVKKTVTKKTVPAKPSTAKKTVPTKAMSPKESLARGMAKEGDRPVEPGKDLPVVPAAVPPVPPAEKVKVAIELDEQAVEEALETGTGAGGEGPATAAVPPPVAPEGAVLRVPVYQVDRSPWQPRVDFNPENLRELSESIKAHGVIQPLVCRRLPEEKGGGYELIAGERRLRAAIEAGLSEVPIVVMEAVDRDAAEMAIVENIQRQDLNVIEEAEGYRTLSEGFGLTQQEVADRVGKARASVANAMRLLDLPDEVKQLLSSSMLSVGHAKVLLSLTEETEQILLARRCVTDGLTVRALERMIARRKAAKDEAQTRTLDIPESHIRYLLDKLHERFNSPIRLQPSVTYANGKRAKGSIQIDFVDNEDLSRLLEIFGVKVD